MEASGFTQPTEITEGDPFAQPAVANDDPFAGSDFGDFEQSPPAVAEQPPVAPPEPAAEPPAPEPVPAPAAPPAPEPAPAPPAAPQEPAQAPQEAPPTRPTPAASDGTTGSTTDLPVVNREGERLTEQEARAAEGAAYAQENAPPEPTAPTTPAPQASPEAAAALAALKERDTPDEQTQAAREAPAEPPAERTDAAGKKTHRRYVVLSVEGPGKFRQLEWREDNDGNMLPPGAKGGRRQSVCVARSSDEALKVGFAAMGSPDDGCTIIAVAAAYFQPKNVKPAAIVLSRTKIAIS